MLKVEKLGYFHENQAEAERLIKVTNAIDLGRIVAKDIGGSDPERMSASNVLKYLQEAFKDSSDVKVEYICLVVFTLLAFSIQLLFVR